jgi:hypothetical protein
VLSTSGDGVTWSAVTQVPIDAPTSASDHFIPGLAVDASTSGSTAKLGLAYHYYPNGSCDSSSCQLFVGSISSTDGGATWSPAGQLAGPMALPWLASTTQGFMVGDYISTSFSGGVAHPLFALGKPPAGGLFDEAMNTATGPGGPVPPAPPAGVPSSPPQAGPPVSGGVQSPLAPPVMRALRLRPRAFRAARRGASIAAASGAVVSYVVSAISTTTFRVQRAVSGHRVRGRCVRGRARGRTRRCRLYVLVPGLFVHRDRAGANRFHFSGRLGGGALRRGAYRLLAIPHDDLGFAGRQSQTAFSIVAAPPVRRR